MISTTENPSDMGMEVNLTLVGSFDSRSFTDIKYGRQGVVWVNGKATGWWKWQDGKVVTRGAQMGASYEPVPDAIQEAFIAKLAELMLCE